MEPSRILKLFWILCNFLNLPKTFLTSLRSHETSMNFYEALLKPAAIPDRTLEIPRNSLKLLEILLKPSKTSLKLCKISWKSDICWTSRRWLKPFGRSLNLLEIPNNLQRHSFRSTSFIPGGSFIGKEGLLLPPLFIIYMDEWKKVKCQNVECQNIEC